MKAPLSPIVYDTKSELHKIEFLKTRENLMYNKMKDLKIKIKL